MNLRNLAPLFLILTVLIALSSCSRKSKNILFNTPNKLKSKEPVTVFYEQKGTGGVYRHTIKPGDRLQIRFFNNYDIGQAANQSATAAANRDGGMDKGYLVNYDSSTTLPLIGRVNLVGMNRLDAAKKLEELYSKFVFNPIIDVNIASLSVTVLGEVNAPGKILLDKESTTITDVIALAGGLRGGGKKNQIKIIRANNEVVLVNLKMIEALQSPNIIIHDNDIVYVEPYGLMAAFEPIVAVGSGISLLMTVTQLVIFSLQIYTISRQ